MRTAVRARAACERHPCTYCGAGMGQPCLTTRGYRCVWPHASRFALTYPQQGWTLTLHPWRTPYDNFPREMLPAAVEDFS